MNRKVRKDSILHGLPASQRARVDKWLFDKGLTYAQVAEACGQMFGVRVSKSSVARYHERVSRGRVRQVKSWNGFRRTGTGTDGTRILDAKVAELMRMTTEEKYQWVLRRLLEAALQEVELPAEIRDDRLLIELMRVIIAARRERNQQVRVSVMRAEFEVKKAQEVLEVFKNRMTEIKNGSETAHTLQLTPCTVEFSSWTAPPSRSPTFICNPPAPC